MNQQQTRASTDDTARLTRAVAHLVRATETLNQSPETRQTGIFLGFACGDLGQMLPPGVEIPAHWEQAPADPGEDIRAAVEELSTLHPADYPYITTALGEIIDLGHRVASGDHDMFRHGG